MPENTERLKNIRNMIGKNAEQMIGKDTPSEAPAEAPQQVPTSPMVPKDSQSAATSTSQPTFSLSGIAQWTGTGQPSSHDRRSPVPFDMRYHKDNIMVDRRMLKEFHDLIGRAGRSKVEGANRIILQVLLAAGYPIDPNLLDRPFTWDDLPK